MLADCQASFHAAAAAQTTDYGRPMPHLRHRRTLTAACVLACIAGTPASLPAAADSPLGWIHSDLRNAYTQDPWSVELILGGLAVNETIDVLNIREDLLAGTRQLEGDSGDLSGELAGIHVGLTPGLSAFYRRQKTALTVDIGTVSSINLLDIDDSLDTTLTSYGVKWNLFESGLFDNARPWHALSLELSRIENSTADFKGRLDRINITENFQIYFTNPQTFAVQNLEEDGWLSRLLYSMPVTDTLAASGWIGYGETEGTSGTGAISDVPFFADALTQNFAMDEAKLQFGASLHWSITPRMPLQLSYEYIRINNADLVIEASSNSSLLPSFLRGANLNAATAQDNHTLHGSLSYWVTPQVHVSVTGKLFRNQFLGIITHYNNPLSSSFANQPYGYVGIEIGARLTAPR